MIYKSAFKEAKELKRTDARKPFLQNIIDKNDMVYAWHGTNTFWTLYFCLNGVDANIEPPTKTLGRGNELTGFNKIKTKGLFVSAERTSGFLQYVQFEVKPSELSISVEMAERGQTEADVLNTLCVGDCIIVEPLKANRIVKVRSNNKEYSRKEFIALFPDPQQYLSDNYSGNFYNDDNSLRRKFMKQRLYTELKAELSLTDNKENMIKEYADSFKADIKRGSTLSIYGITKEETNEIIIWLEGQL